MPCALWAQPRGAADIMLAQAIDNKPFQRSNGSNSLTDHDGKAAEQLVVYRDSERLV